MNEHSTPQHFATMQDPGSEVRAVDELPPCFRQLYGFRYFNIVQSEAFDCAFGRDANMVSTFMAARAAIL